MSHVSYDMAGIISYHMYDIISHVTHAACLTRSTLLYAVCCMVLQCVAVCCIVLQCVTECVAVCCRVCCSVLRCVAVKRLAAARQRDSYKSSSC